MKNILNIFSGVATWSQKIINIFTGFEKVTKTVTAFKEALEIFEAERCEIWGDTKPLFKSAQKKQEEPFLQEVDMKHSGGLVDEFKKDDKDVK